MNSSLEEYRVERRGGQKEAKVKRDLDVATRKCGRI